MPPKIRELIAQLERAGFVDRGGRGSHHQVRQVARTVFAELCMAVEEAIELYKEDGKPLPPPTAGATEILELYTDERLREFAATNSIPAETERRVEEYLKKRAEK
jgi:hypothetical protein